MMIGTFDALWAIVLDDLGSADWVANLGITFFALPLIFLGSFGGRLAQRVGPFRLGPFGLLLGAGFMFAYGFVPTGAAMLAVGIVHAMCDGFTVSSAAVGVGMVAPPDRQASAQGMLGAAGTLVGGLTAVLAGVLYFVGRARAGVHDVFGRDDHAQPRRLVPRRPRDPRSPRRSRCRLEQPTVTAQI